MNKIDDRDNALQTSQVAKPQTDAIGLGEILRLLARRKLLILSTVVICLICTGVYTWQQPKKYEAICRIDIDLNTPQSSLNLQSAGRSMTSDDQKMTTQLGIITSQSIAWDVITRLSLNKRPEFMGRPVSNSEHDLSSLSDFERYSLVRRFQSGLVVQYERATEIAQIRYKNVSPTLAALIANTIAESYIQRNFQTKYTTTRNTSTWLNGQLQNLRKQVTDAQQAFDDFQKKTGILQTDENHNAILDRVVQLNVSLSAAQTQRILKEIAYRESGSSDPDQVLPAASLPTLQALRTQKTTLESQYASLTPKYGDAYPRVVQLKSEIDHVQAEIAIQIQRGRKQLEIEYQASLANEAKLSAAVEAQKQEIFSMNENALRYNILQRQVVSSRDLYEDLTRKLQEAEITSGLSSDAISVIDPALAPNIPAEPKKTLNLEVGFFLGLVLGIAIAFLLESVNATVSAVEDVTFYSGLPVLSLVPHAGSRREVLPSDGPHPEAEEPAWLDLLQNPRSHFAEAFRNLRSALLLSSAGAPPRIIAICSAWPKEGKSTVAINLAAVLAQAGKRVLLVDADLKRPSLHTKLGLILPELGLSGLLTTPEDREVASYVLAGVKVPTLDFLGAGRIPPSSAELLMSNKMSALLEEWRSVYDFVVLDTAPVLAVSDTSALASIVDTIVLVVRAGQTPRQSLRTVRDSILGVRGKIAGVLLNDVKVSSEVYYTYYGGRGKYGAYYVEDENVKSR